MSKTIVLYSGGLDSTVVLAQEIAKGNEVLALSIDYNQSNRAELTRCAQLASYWGFPHQIINVHLERTDARAEIPARNTVFLAKALEFALLRGADTVAYGAEPDATYTDSSPAYIATMDALMQLHGVKLIAPIRGLAGKLDVLRLALDLGVPLDLVHSSRTDRLDGGDKASLRFLSTLHKLFFAINPSELLQSIAAAHSFSDVNPFDLRTRQTGSFKYLPALFVLANSTVVDNQVTIYTTGNWGRSLMTVNQRLQRLRNPKVVIDETKLAQNQFNTDSTHGVWGTKQALSRLPRPQYFKHTLQCRVNQGHLKAALQGLGYEFNEEGIPLITE